MLLPGYAFIGIQEMQKLECLQRRYSRHGAVHHNPGVLGQERACLPVYIRLDEPKRPLPNVLKTDEVDMRRGSSAGLQREPDHSL